MTGPAPTQTDAAPALRLSTLLLTNSGKIVGLVIAVNETLLRPTIRDGALAVAAGLIFGAQTAENIILGVIDRVFPRS